MVPGGKFNEMYGWDSFFIVLGLLHDNKIMLAKNMTDNAIYEVMHYGKVLNANRRYYLARSQPPLLTQMILAVFAKTQDYAWLQKTLPAINKYYLFWVTPPHVIPGLGLSRYYATGQGPTVESNPRVYLLAKQSLHHLSESFYKNDRSIRESGFDMTDKFGPYAKDILDIAPVGLNTLLYQYEHDTEFIYKLLGSNDKATIWHNRAVKRAQLINKYCWDSSGYYFDYNFKKHKQKKYIFATMFYPLWAGIASVPQATKVKNNLKALERKGGIVASPYRTGKQWDYPFAWAPMQWFAVKGLHHYHFHKEARRITHKFKMMVESNYQRYGVIAEKYDGELSSLQIGKQVHYGYAQNQLGFGWTNGVYLDLQ